MEKIEKSTLTFIGKIDEFSIVIKKLTVRELLTQNEKTYILTCAIMFLEEYNKDHRYKSYFEFAYYILLKYSVTYQDYRPLYDVAINVGFYPIAKYIFKKELLVNESIENILLDFKLNKFKNDKYIETIEQYYTRKEVIESQSKEVCYIAPTSFGKSSVIYQYIKENGQYDKVGIIVPTKSLLAQTYRKLKKQNFQRKIIIHDEMYNGEERFIAVLTQERALRILEKNDVYFDCLFIDEAHNLFAKGPRNILLSRVIRKNKIRNINHKVIYLSPLIDQSNNIQLYENQHIVEQKIDFNIKEPEIFEYRLNGEVYQYNRFVNQFYLLQTYVNCFDYIKSKVMGKSFFYLYSPKKIEMFAKDLYKQVGNNVNNKISKMKDLMCKYVHKDFYINKLVDRGIIYLHGKLPDLIKEFLEYKFKTSNELRYLIANSVVLEGVNLPVETLFIMNTYNIGANELTNLIGRVNRLNDVFNEEKGNLNKLMPHIHFINSVKYAREKSNMTGKIRLLRDKKISDKIMNPVLLSFDYAKASGDEEKIERVNRIISQENLVLSVPDNEIDDLKIKMLELGINEILSFNQENINAIYQKITEVRNDIRWQKLSVLDKVYLMFVKGILVIDKEFKRLENEKARKYYAVFIKIMKSNSLNEQINQQYRHFKNRIADNDAYMYMGKSYGEIRRPDDDINSQKVYVDLTTKTDEELINLVIVRIKMEQDFISFKYFKFVQLLFDLGLISEDEYNNEVYGTTDLSKISLFKLGLTPGIINHLEEDGQIVNLYLDENGNIQGNTDFYTYIKTQDEFIRFEVGKYL